MLTHKYTDKFRGLKMDVLSIALTCLSGAGAGLLVGNWMNSDIGTPGRAFTGLVGGALLMGIVSLISSLGGSFLGGVFLGAVGGAILSYILGKLMRPK